MDTKAKDDAMQLAEDARQADWEAVSFTAEVFKGNFRWDLLHPFPAQSAEDKKIGDDYIEKIHPVIEQNIDPWQIDEDGEYPREALEAMAAVGALRHEDPQGIRRTGPFGHQLRPRARLHRRLLRLHGRLHLRAPVHRRAATAQGIRHRGAEAQVPAPARERRDLGIRAHRARRGLRPRADDDGRHAVRRRQVLRAERRQAAGARTSRTRRRR